MITFSNPRLEAIFTDWPLGGNRRGNCTFTTEFKPQKGWRVSRVTTGKAKTTTFGGRLAIVDGSNGRTYILQQSQYGPMITVTRSDFMSATGDELGLPNAADHTFSPADGDVFVNLSKLIEAANSGFVS